MAKFYPEVHQDLLDQLKQFSMERFKSRVQKPEPEAAPSQEPAEESHSEEDIAILEEHYNGIE